MWFKARCLLATFEDKSIKIYLTQSLLFAYSIFNSLYSHVLVITWYFLAFSVNKSEPDFGPARKPAYPATGVTSHPSARNCDVDAETIHFSSLVGLALSSCCVLLLVINFHLGFSKIVFHKKTLRSVAARKQDGIFKFRHFQSRNGCRNTIWA